MNDNVIVLNLDKKGGGTQPNQNYVSDVLRATAMAVNSTRNINNWDQYLSSEQPANFEGSKFFEMLGQLSRPLESYLKYITFNSRRCGIVGNFVFDKDSESLLIRFYNVDNLEEPAFEILFVINRNFIPHEDRIPGRCRCRPIKYLVDGEKMKCPVGLGQMTLMLNEMAIHSMDSDHQHLIENDETVGFGWARNFGSHHLEASVLLSKSFYKLTRGAS